MKTTFQILAMILLAAFAVTIIAKELPWWAWIILVSACVLFDWTLFKDVSPKYKYKTWSGTWRSFYINHNVEGVDALMNKLHKEGWKIRSIHQCESQRETWYSIIGERKV